MQKTGKPPPERDRVSSLKKGSGDIEALKQNKILAALPASELAQLIPKLKLIKVELDEILNLAEQPIEYVYFPISGIISLLTVLKDGATVEVAVIGSEGIVGVSAIMGAEKATNEALAQGGGQAFRMRAQDLRAAFDKSGKLREQLLKYTHALLAMVTQNAACNRMHTLEQRLARWLLLTHDRVRKDEFVFTQEFMSRMLGVRRAGVSVAANTLRQAGLIEYSRGGIHVLNRAGLEDASCECYRTIKAQSDGFFKP